MHSLLRLRYIHYDDITTMFKDATIGLDSYGEGKHQMRIRRIKQRVLFFHSRSLGCLIHSISQQKNVDLPLPCSFNIKEKAPEIPSIAGQSK